MAFLDFLDPELVSFCQDMVKCYQKFSQSKLIELSDRPIVEALYQANFILVAHHVQDDPVFCFANLKAQALWEMDWQEFTSTASRLSAPENARAERQTLLDAASEKNIVMDYSGVRVSKTGKLFQIEDVILWNIFNADEQLIGQAARFDVDRIEFI